MKKLLAAALLLFSLHGAHAQEALVVGTCGTAPPTFVAGAIMPITIDTNGKLCTTGGGGGSGVSSIGNYSTDSTLTMTGTGSGPYTGAVTIKCTVATSSQIGCADFGTGLTVTAGSVTPTFGTATNQVAEGGVITAGGPTGSATVVPIITYNAAGQLTTVTSTTIAPAIGSVTGLGTGVATALGDAVNTSGGVATSAVTTLSSLTTTGTITSGGLGSGATLGGVTAAFGSDAKGDIYYNSGSSNVIARLAEVDGDCLKGVSGAPAWAACSGGGNANFGTASGNTANDIVTMSNTTVGVQDSGTLLSSLAPKASPTLTGTVTLPDSGTWTSGGINGSAIGGSTAAAGAFTTLSASSTVSGTGFSTYLASPPAIGGTAAAAGTFTTLVSTAHTVTSASANALAVGLNGVTNPAFNVDASTASQVAGLDIVGAATGGTVAVKTTDSGSNNNLTINAKGTGTIGIGSVSTGVVTITPATTVTGALHTASTANSSTIASNAFYSLGGVGVTDSVNLPSGSSTTIGNINWAGYYLWIDGSASVFAAGGNYSETGGNNIGIGQSALHAVTSGPENIAIGDDALQNFTAQSSTGPNVAVGYEAGQNISTGYNNVALGTQVMGGTSAVMTGNNNIGLGNGDLQALTSGSDNTADGQGSFYGITTGQYNTTVGASNGGSYTSSESYNTIIGAQLTGTVGESNTIQIGDGQAHLRADYGHTTAAAWTFAGKIYMTGLTAGSGSSALCINSNQIETDTSSTICGISDINVKDLIAGQDIKPAAALDAVVGWRTPSYRYKPKYQDHGKAVHVSLIANDVEATNPNCVHKVDDEGHLNYDDRCVEAYLVASIKQLKADNDDLRAQLAALHEHASR